MKFINECFQKTCFCKRAALYLQIQTQPDILFLVIWSLSLAFSIILEVTYSVCFKLVLKEKFRIWRTGTWQGQRWKGESASQSCSRAQPGHCFRNMCLFESKERGYISQIGRMLDTTTGKNYVKKKVCWQKWCCSVFYLGLLSSWSGWMTSWGPLGARLCDFVCT